MKLVKRFFISKSNGKLRPLEISVLEDKIVQYVVREILQTLFETLFFDCSYAYRPKRSARMAVENLRDELMNKYSWIIESDISGLFDNVNHDWMLKMLEKRINGKALIGRLSSVRKEVVEIKTRKKTVIQTDKDHNDGPEEIRAMLFGKPSAVQIQGNEYHERHMDRRNNSTCR